MRTTEYDDASARPRLTLHRMRLEVITGPDAGTVLETEGHRARIGADRRNELALTDPKVSRAHAEVVRSERGVFLRDRGSTNGTWMGSARVTEAQLAGIQTFRVGRSQIRFTPLDEEVDVRPSEATQFANSRRPLPWVIGG